MLAVLAIGARGRGFCGHLLLSLSLSRSLSFSCIVERPRERGLWTRVRVSGEVRVRRVRL